MHLDRWKTLHKFFVEIFFITFSVIFLWTRITCLDQQMCRRARQAWKFWNFYVLLPTLKGCNFFSTEPILKCSDVFSRWESNSFIFAVFVARTKTRVPSHDYLWVWISENSKIRSKIHLYLQRRALSQTSAGYRVITYESTIQ